MKNIWVCDECHRIINSEFIYPYEKLEDDYTIYSHDKIDEDGNFIPCGECHTLNIEDDTNEVRILQ